jgi:hypothetical protein
MSPFWTGFWLIFIFLPLVFLWVFGMLDVIRRHDLSGIVKVLWILVILFLPILGLIVYFLARPHDVPMGNTADSAASASATKSPAEELEMLEGLRDRGVLTEEQFEQQKHRVLGT